MKKIFLILTIVFCSTISKSQCDTNLIKSWCSDLTVLDTTFSKGIDTSLCMCKPERWDISISPNIVVFDAPNLTGVIYFISKRYNRIGVLYDSETKFIQLSHDDFFNIMCYGILNEKNLKMLKERMINLYFNK